MRTNKNSATILIECKDKDNCDLTVNSLEKRYRRNIIGVYRTMQFSDAKYIRNKIAHNIELGTADIIVEIVANKYKELENIKREFETNLPKTIASVKMA